MLSYNGDAARQEEINWKSCPPAAAPFGSREPSPAGLPARSLHRDSVCKPRAGNKPGGLLFLLFHGAKSRSLRGQHCPGSRGDTAPTAPHPSGSSTLPCGLKTNQLYWPSHRRWGRSTITDELSSRGLKRAGGAGPVELGRGAQRRAQSTERSPLPSTESGNQDATARTSAFKSLSFHRSKF